MRQPCLRRSHLPWLTRLAVGLSVSAVCAQTNPTNTTAPGTPNTDSNNVAKFIGLALAIGGNLLISISLNLQKYVHSQNLDVHYTKVRSARAMRLQPRRRRLWLPPHRCLSGGWLWRSWLVASSAIFQHMHLRLQFWSHLLEVSPC